MSWWEDALKKIVEPVPLPWSRHAGTTWSACGAVDDVDGMVDGLRTASDYLDKAQYVPDFDKYVDKLSQVKEGIDVVAAKVSVAKNLCGDYESIMKIQSGVRALERIGNIQNDPEGAARAFGQILSGAGKLAHYLPWPASAYVGILEDAEDFFVNLRRQMDPAVHMREPGIREVIDNL